MKQTLIIISLLLIVNGIFAQDIAAKLEQLVEENGKGYIKPFVTAFGSNLNSGLYSTADVLKPSVIRPVRFALDFKAMVAFVPDEDLTFEAVNVDGSTVETATVFGDKGAEFMGEQIYPNGANFNMIPLVVPQLRVGVPFGNELMVRFIPATEIDKVGDLSFWGAGIKHSIDQYIPLFPVHLAVQGTYQQLSVGDMLEVTSWALNAQVSKSFLMLTLYGGVGLEETNLTAKYDYIPDENDPDNKIPVKFELTGDNNLRATAGFRWALLPFIHLNADYSIAAHNVASAGLSLSF